MVQNIVFQIIYSCVFFFSDVCGRCRGRCRDRCGVEGPAVCLSLGPSIFEVWVIGFVYAVPQRILQSEARSPILKYENSETVENTAVMY